MLGWWFPKVAVIAVKSPLTGTCVTKRRGNVPATTGVGPGGGVAGGAAGGLAGDGAPAFVTGWLVSPPVQDTIPRQSTAYPTRWIVRREGLGSRIAIVVLMINLLS